MARGSIAVLIVPAAAGTVVSLGAVPPGMIAATAVPALCWTAVLLAIGRRPTGPSLAMLLWGSGVAAPLASVVNDWLQAGGGGDLVAMLAAPVVEEAVKGSALVALVLLLPEELRDARDGIVYGALVGVGFGAVENASYLTIAAIQGGTGGLLSGMYLRGFVEGLTHAVFTGAVGAGLGWARQAWAARAASVLGFGVAVGQHVVWNAVGSRAITVALCGAASAGGPCADTPTRHALFVTAPLIAAACLGPGGIALLVVAHIAGRRRSAPASLEW